MPAPFAAPADCARCGDTDPNRGEAGTAFFGGPGGTGPLHGLQAERARIPYAHVGLVKIPRGG